MNHVDNAAQKTRTEENLVWIIKTVLFVMPPTIVNQFAPRHFLLFGASLIFGALLQAVVPPRRYKFFHILGIAVIGAAVNALAQLKGWW
jgi:hypothetical protein